MSGHRPVQNRLTALQITLLIGLSGAGMGANAAESFADRIEQGVVADDTMPATCASPYRETGLYFQFFSSAIAVQAAKRGPQAPGVAELFAVAELRNRMEAQFPNLGEESPLDRLIVAQLCQYQAIKNKNNSQGPTAARSPITASDPELMTHLQKISGPLYKDAREVMVQALAARARMSKQEESLKDQWDRIKKARQLGSAKVDDLFFD